MTISELVGVGYNTVDITVGASEGVSHAASMSGSAMNFCFFLVIAIIAWVAFI